MENIPMTLEEATEYVKTLTEDQQRVFEIGTACGRSIQAQSSVDRAVNASLQVGNYALSRYDGGYWLAHASGEGMQVRPDRLLHLMHELWQEF